MKKFYVLVLLFVITLPAPVFGGVLPGFGGYVVFTTPCTCLPSTTLVNYVPLFPLKYPYTFHALLLTPASIRYAYQQFLGLPPPSAWHLGTFVPAPTTPCLGVAPACVPAADGVIATVGSSYPGFPPPKF